MKKISLANIILSAYLSEKAMTASGNDNNCYVFRVHQKATKTEIKHAVESLFRKKVKKVRVINLKGQSRRFSGIVGYKKNTRKAYITLASGQQIDFGEFQVAGN